MSAGTYNFREVPTIDPELWELAIKLGLDPIQLLLSAGLSKDKVRLVLQASKLSTAGLLPESGPGCGAIRASDDGSQSPAHREEAREWSLLLGEEGRRGPRGRGGGGSSVGSCDGGSSDAGFERVSGGDGFMASSSPSGFSGIVVLDDPSRHHNARYAAAHVSGMPKPRIGGMTAAGMPQRRATCTSITLGGSLGARMQSCDSAPGPLDLAANPSLTPNNEGSGGNEAEPWSRAVSGPLPNFDRLSTGSLGSRAGGSNLSRRVAEGARSNSDAGAAASVNVRDPACLQPRPPAGGKAGTSVPPGCPEALSFKHMICTTSSRPDDAVLPSPRPPRVYRTSASGSSRGGSLSPASTASPFSSPAAAAGGLLARSSTFGSFPRLHRLSDPASRRPSPSLLPPVSPQKTSAPSPSVNSRSKQDAWVARTEAHVMVGLRRASSTSDGTGSPPRQSGYSSSFLLNLRSTSQQLGDRDPADADGAGDLHPSFQGYLAGVEARNRRGSKEDLEARPAVVKPNVLEGRRNSTGGALHMMTHGC